MAISILLDSPPMEIRYNSVDAAAARVRDKTPMTEDEARALVPWMGQHAQILPRIQMECAVQQIAAINRFNRTRGKLAIVSICASIAQVIVAAVAVLIAVRR